jgi:hypothetical protein
MRNLTIFLGIVLSSQIAAAQEKTPTPNSVQEYLSDTEAIRNEKLKFYKKVDPFNRISFAMHELLWSKNIKLSLAYDPTKYQDKGVRDNQPNSVDKFKIDEIAISTTVLIHEKDSDLATGFMKKYSDQFVGKPIDFDGLYGLVLDLNDEINAAWDQCANKQFDDLILRIELQNYFSKIRKRAECWLWVEVSHANAEPYDLFVRDEVKKLISRGEKGSSKPFERLEAQHMPVSHPLVRVSNWTRKTRKLEIDREKVKVAVPDDHLSVGERESRFVFKLIDQTDRKRHQIEKCSWSAGGLREQWVLSEATNLILDRMPYGSYLTFEEIHLRMGSVVNVLQRSFPDFKLSATIEDYEKNGIVFSGLKLNVTRLD